MESELTKYDIQYLLAWCRLYPELYNQIANKLDKKFGLKGAELTLLITYFVSFYGGKAEQ